MSEIPEIEDTACSYNEWRKQGYYVRKGQKSRFRDALGVPQFCLDQVITYDRLKELARIREVERISSAYPSDPWVGKFWSIHDTAPDLDPRLLPVPETASYLMSKMDPNHQKLRQLEAHCEGVFFKHHGMCDFEAEEMEWDMM